MRIRKWAADVFFDRNPVWNRISAGNLFETDAIWIHGLKIRRWAVCCKIGTGFLRAVSGFIPFFGNVCGSGGRSVAEPV